MLKALIFDFDGVVVDTIKLHYSAWEKMFSAHDVDFDFEIYKEKVDGIPRNDGARNVLSHLEEESIIEEATKKQNYFLDMVESDGVEVHSDAIDLIHRAKKAGLKIGVISSSKSCRMILEKVGLLNEVDTVVTVIDIKQGKPHPEIFLKAAENMEVQAYECIGIEDAILGVEAILNASMKAIGIERYGDLNRLKKADLVVEDLNDVTLKQMEEM